MAVDSAVDAPTDAQDYDGAYTFVISNFLSREEKLCRC